MDVGRSHQGCAPTLLCSRTLVAVADLRIAGFHEVICNAPTLEVSLYASWWEYCRVVSRVRKTDRG